MNKGRIVQVMGPVVDVVFEDGNLPYIKDALEVENNGKKCIMEVAQHLGNNEVRCLMLAAIGENDNLVRWETCKNMDYLGIQVDKQKNEVRGKDTIISTEQSTTTVMTVTTDEELVIAMDTVRLS